MPRVRAKRRSTEKPQSKLVSITSRWANSNEPWLQEFTVFVPFWRADNWHYYFLCYSPNNGKIMICKPDYTNGIFGAWPQPTPDSPVLPRGLTNLALFIGTPYMLYQNTGDSNASLAKIVWEDAGGSYTVTHEEISGLPVSGQLVPMSSGADLYVAAYDEHTSQLTLYKIDLDKKKAAQQGEPIHWDGGWTAFASLDGQSFVCLSAATGDMGAGQLSGDKIIAVRTPHFHLNGRTTLTALIGNSGPTFLAYAQNSNTVRPEIYTISWAPPSMPVFTLKPSEDWPRNISSIATFTIEKDNNKDQIFYLIYQALITGALAGKSSTITISSGVKPGYPEDDQPLT